MKSPKDLFIDYQSQFRNPPSEEEYLAYYESLLEEVASRFDETSEVEQQFINGEAVSLEEFLLHQEYAAEDAHRHSSSTPLDELWG